ncbi:MAG TPA: aconitase family protein [Polyangiaceae bacterium]|nr:aconitase family protein [Polyangiaceae bacterium]
MAQKIFAGRASDPLLRGERVDVEADQIALARAPFAALAEGLAAGLKKASLEAAVAYETACVGESAFEQRGALLGHGLTVARAGAGFPAPVHIERFASPARLCLTDDPRMAATGGVGMLALWAPPSQLGAALAGAPVSLAPPRSVHVQLSGRSRPFVCARDIALELLRRGLAEVVRRVDAEHRAGVVVEFGGPGVRLLSVGERAVLAGVAPQVGAAAALFPSDERTEVFLRDQRRSKAHRGLSPDAGAPFDEVMQIDLGAVDPLAMDEDGQVRAVRELSGKPVAQVLLGGDSGVTLRDLLAVAMLLKSKRVPASVEFLLAPPTRQMLEVLAAEGALADLIATGARLVEPDAGVLTGAYYPPPRGALALRTADADSVAPDAPRPLVVSAETLAYAVATGNLGDPRGFKRPVRVTVPRALPTDDVLVVRERRGHDPSRKDVPAEPGPSTGFRGAAGLDVVAGPPRAAFLAEYKGSGVMAVCASLRDLRDAAASAVASPGVVRAVLADHVPAWIASVLSGVGVLALEADAAAQGVLRSARSASLPAPSTVSDDAMLVLQAAGNKVSVHWVAGGVERSWAAAGTTRAARR